MSDTETREVSVSSVSFTADPGPLGLAGFALTTFVLSLNNAGLFGTADVLGIVLPLALFYGGLAQLIAGIMEFRRNNTFGAVAFTSYGAFWMSLSALVYFILPTIPKGTNVGHLLGVFLLAWTIFTVYMTLAAVKVNKVLGVLFVVLLVTFILLTWGNFAGNTSIVKIGGYFGILTALIAWYASAANVVNGTWGKKILPVG